VRRALLLAAVLATAGAGCAAGPGQPRPASGAPVMRCLAEDERMTGARDRPLFFLFCIQSP
jgi:hypothetical protein